MTKVLRKYKTWFIALFGSFLMLTFLVSGPGSFFNPDPRKAVEGRIGDTKVRAGEMMTAASEVEAMRAVVPGMVQAVLGGEESKNDRTLHWVMLKHEAERMGFVGSAADAEGLLASMTPFVAREMLLQRALATMPANQARIVRANPQFADMFIQQASSQLTDEDRAQLDEDAASLLLQMRDKAAADYRLSRDDMNLALANLRGVSRMIESTVAAGRLSDRRMVLQARSTLENVLADALVLRASNFRDPAWMPDDAAIAAQYERFRSVEAGTPSADNPHGFGYVLPARVRLSFLRLDRAGVEAAITLDPVEVAKYYQRNRAQFPGEFPAERAAVETAMKQTVVAEVLAEADRAFKAQLRSVTRDLPTLGSIRRVPQGWTAPDLDTFAQAMVQGVQSATRTTIPAPTVTRLLGPWTLIPSAFATPDLGAASLPTGAARVPLNRVLEQVHELDKDSPLGLQVGVPFENALEDASGNRFYILIHEARPSSPPDSIEDVRDTVITDLRDLRAYEALSAAAADLESAAGSGGLDAAVPVAQRLVPAGATPPFLQVMRSLTFSPVQADPLRLDDGAQVRDGLTALALGLGMLTPATPENQAARTMVVAIPADLSVVLAQLVGVGPITRERLRTIGLSTARSLSANELAELAPEGEGEEAINPFSFEAMKTRLNWKPARPQA